MPCATTGDVTSTAARETMRVAGQLMVIGLIRGRNGADMGLYGAQWRGVALDSLDEVKADRVGCSLLQPGRAFLRKEGEGWLLPTSSWFVGRSMALSMRFATSCSAISGRCSGSLPASSETQDAPKSWRRTHS